jgi:hypothetical protein
MTGEHVPRPLWHDTFGRDQVHFSPDGKWVAYSSTESGRLEVYVAAFPSLDKKRQVSNAGGAEPMWRHDGKELYYLSLDGNMMAVSVNAEATMDTGLPKVLFRADVLNPYGGFDVTGYNVSRDGQRFLILRARQTAKQRWRRANQRGRQLGRSAQVVQDPSPKSRERAPRGS